MSFAARSLTMAGLATLRIAGLVTLGAEAKADTIEGRTAIVRAGWCRN